MDFQGTFFDIFFFVSGARFVYSRKLLEGFQRIVNSFDLEHFQSKKYFSSFSLSTLLDSKNDDLGPKTNVLGVLLGPIVGLETT